MNRLKLLFAITALLFAVNPLYAQKIGDKFVQNNFAYTIIGDTDVKIEKHKTVGSYKIPSQIEYKKKIFTVTELADVAFLGCRELYAITIPNTITTIGKSAFSDCSNLSGIDIPNSVATIGNYAFRDCSGLRSITVPNTAIKYGMEVFVGCNALKYITIGAGDVDLFMCKNTGRYPNYTFINDQVESISFLSSNIGNIRDYDYAKLSHIIIPIDFDTDAMPNSWKRNKNLKISYHKESAHSFVKRKVEDDINKWQIKGEFEKSDDWKLRVNEISRQNRIKELVAKYSTDYFNVLISIKEKDSDSTIMTLEGYDADNESYLISSTLGDVLLPVPIADASSFKSNWNDIAKTAKPQFLPSGEEIVLAGISFTHAGKTYTYDSKAEVKYTVTDIAYNFDPINIDETSTVAKTQGIGGNANIERRNISVGASDVATNIPQTSIKNENTFVLIIANENYTSEAQVNFAINDGQTFKKYCEQTLGIPSKNIRIVEDVTSAPMSRNIDWIKSVLNEHNGANAILYYSGHGVPNEATGDAYLLPVDVGGGDYQYAYSIKKLYKELGATGAKSITYFIDACFSGAKRDGDMMVAARGVAIKAKSGVLSGNSVAFTASSGDETAYAYKEKGHGIFTYFLLKKLQESKGDITYGELGEYIKTQVRKESMLVNPKVQTPTVISSPDLHDSWKDWKFIK